MEQVEGLVVTKRELQIVLYAYADHFVGEVELAATEIYTSSDDPEIQRAAIEWNLNATPEMMSACFSRDPLVGMMGAWAFAIQLREFFETGNGRDVFGPHQDIAIDTSRRMEKSIARIAHEVWPEGGIDKAAPGVAKYATEHPLENMRMVRDVAFSAKALEALGAELSGGLSAAGDMNEMMVAMNDRMNLMMPYVQRQMYWHSAMLMADSRELASDITDSTLAAVQRETMAGMGPAFEFMDQQRALITADLARERDVILTALAMERTEVLKSLSSERNEILLHIANERNATMRDIDALTRMTLEHVSETSHMAIVGSVDHVFNRTLQLLALPFALFGVLLIIVMLWVRNTTKSVLEKLEQNARSRTPQ